jgi:hypothetical protein
MVSGGFGMKWSSPRHSICLFCHEMVKPQTWHQCVLSWNNEALDIVSVDFGMKWSSHRNSICLFCHESLGLDQFMTKQTDTMSGAWPFHAKTNWYHVWGFIISWQNTLMPCLELQTWHQCVLSWNDQSPDIVSVEFGMKWSSPRHSINLFCHEMVKLQTWHQCVLSWNDKSPDMVSVGFGMKWSSPRHSICLFCRG